MENKAINQHEEQIFLQEWERENNSMSHNLDNWFIINYKNKHFIMSI